jgi:hypothetical protein
MRPKAGQALQLALFFALTSTVPIGNLRLAFEIHLVQEASIPLMPGQSPVRVTSRGPPTMQMYKLPLQFECAPG